MCPSIGRGEAFKVYRVRLVNGLTYSPKDVVEDNLVSGITSHLIFRILLVLL